MPHIEIVVIEPLPSGAALIDLAGEAHKEFKNKLTTRISIKTWLPAWTVFVLVEKCGVGTAVKALELVNGLHLFGEEEHYALAPDPNDPKAKDPTGRQKYNRERVLLEARIKAYKLLVVQ